MKEYPNQERLKELFDYDEGTGNFIRIKKSSKYSNDVVGKIAGFKHKLTGYIVIRVDGIQYQSHRLVWIYMNGDIPKSLMIDHVNGIKDDNRIVNLRLATNEQNQQNQRKRRSDNTSGFLGVSFNKSKNKFIASIQVNGKQKHLGLFERPEEAYEAYLDAKRKYHEFSTI